MWIDAGVGAASDSVSTDTDLLLLGVSVDTL